jgi:hypothetical protein
LEDRSHEVPPGCSLRKYRGENDTSSRTYWLGTLPPGVTGFDGHKSRSRVVRAGLRSEEDAIAEIKLWLETGMEEWHLVAPTSSESGGES